MEPSNIQVFTGIESAKIQMALRTHRPILTHLNGDTTWLLQLPYPPELEYQWNQPPTTRRGWYNIIIDPWLQGPSCEIAPWFYKQWHGIEPSLRTVQELNERFKEFDAVDAQPQLGTEKRNTSCEIGKMGCQYIDAIVISHEFADHCHKNTLLEFSSETPVFATEKAAKLIISWNHFTAVQTIPLFTARDVDWRRTSTDPLPPWIGISRICSNSDPINLHAALLIAFNLGVSARSVNAKYDMDQGEAIIYSPHGTPAERFGLLHSAKPPLRALALLHGLDEVSIGPFPAANLGAHNGLKAQRIIQSKYWVLTHDEIRIEQGLVSSFIKRKAVDLEEAMKKEREEAKGEHLSATNPGGKVTFSGLLIRSGESIILV